MDQSSVNPEGSAPVDGSSTDQSDLDRLPWSESCSACRLRIRVAVHFGNVIYSHPISLARLGITVNFTAVLAGEHGYKIRMK